MTSSPATGDLFEPAPPAALPPRARPAALPPPVESAPRRRELWLCLHLPGLPLAAVARGPSAADPPAAGRRRPRQPCAVLDGEGAQQAVVACNAAAAARGIAPGLGANAALALVPALELLPRQPHAEAALLERLARWATRFTPVVSLEPPAALLAEVRGSLGLFGGAEALRERVLEELAGWGLEASAALAPTPRAALWMARAGLVARDPAAMNLPAVAGRLPLACLGWPPAVIERLVATGVRNVADLARLPRDGFARRFGPDLLDELDEAFGRRAQPRRRTVAPERCDERLELPAECVSSAALWPACEHLLGRLQAFLRARAAGLAGLVLELGHRGAPATRLVLGLARPSADVGHLRLLLGERLDRTPLPAPVVALRLRSSVAVPVELREPGLFARLERDGDPGAAARLLERLRARLGHDAVFGVDCVSEHRPEAAWRIAEPVLPDSAEARRAAAAARGAVAESAVPTRALHHARAGEVASGPPERGSFSSRASEVGARPDPARARGTRGEEGDSPHFRWAQRQDGDSPHFRRAQRGIHRRRTETGTVPLGTVPRPLWMLAAPQPLGERDGVPLYGRAPLALIAGPERIESGWWDGGDVRRDYYVAHARSGLRLWVYRSREPGGGWWLHGVFG